MGINDDLRIRRTRPLIAPAILEEDIPLNDAGQALIREARSNISAILHGQDPRLLVIVGPCSIHDLDAAREYATRLAPVAQALHKQLCIVMRVYFEKPRTTVGWKGFINDPDIDDSYHVNKGLRGARQLLADVTATGLPAATEFLDTTFGQYLTDFISWGAIGARTVESQIHRQLASGLSMPVGIKNATSGNIDVALDAIVAAQRSHLFPSLTKEGAPALLETTGNHDSHLVLRGSAEPNFDPDSVSQAVAALATRGIDTGLVVDCSHGNSSKDHRRQPDVARAIIEQRRRGQTRLVGCMLESHLVEGRQTEPASYGQSITDACIGWEETHALLEELAAAEVA